MARCSYAHVQVVLTLVLTYVTPVVLTEYFVSGFSVMLISAAVAFFFISLLAVSVEIVAI